MRIKIVNVDVESKGEGKKQYEVAEVLYDVAGKKQTFKLISFTNPDGFSKIKNANKGDEFDVQIEKNAQGYNQWVSVNPANGAAPEPKTTSSAGVNFTAKAPSNFGRDFETKEERAARQVLIVKQSSLSAAVATLTPGAKSVLDYKAVIDLAQQYTDWVFASTTEDAAADLFAQDNDLPDIPY